MNDQAPRSSQPEEGDRVLPMVLFRQGLYWTLGAVATAATTAAIYAARDVLIRVLIALFLAISLDPAVRRLTRWHIRRGFAILLVILVTLGAVAAFLQAVIPAMVQQFQKMVNDFPDYVTSVQDRWASLRRTGDQFHVTSHIDSVLANLPGRLGSGGVRSHRTGVLSGAVNSDRGGVHHLFLGRPTSASPGRGTAVPAGSASPCQPDR